MTRTELINFMNEKATAKINQLKSYNAYVIYGDNYAILESKGKLAAFYSDYTGRVYVIDYFNPQISYYVSRFSEEVGALKAVYLYRRCDGLIEKDLCGYCCDFKLTDAEYEIVEDLDFITHIENKIFGK